MRVANEEKWKERLGMLSYMCESCIISSKNEIT